MEGFDASEAMLAVGFPELSSTGEVVEGRREWCFRGAVRWRLMRARALG